MALKYQGNKLAQAFMIEVGKPIDVRAVVDLKSDLIAAATFGGYAYNGMSVVVAATGKIFTLIDVEHITSEASWIEQATMADIASISGAMHFVGVAHDQDAGSDKTVALPIGEGGATVTKYITTNKAAWENGDVCIYSTKEFVYANSTWYEIGDEANVVVSIDGVKGAITLQKGQTAAGSINLAIVNGQLQATLVAPDASDILMTGYEKAQAEAAVDATDTITEAVGKVEFKVDKLKEEVIKNEQTTAAALNELDDRINALDQKTDGIDEKIDEFKEEVESSEEAISAALNDLNKRVDATVAQEVKRYVQTVTSDGGSHSVTIAASTHGCGTDPLVSVFYAGVKVEIDESVDASGNITIAWAATTTIDASHALKIVVMG